LKPQNERRRKTIEYDMVTGEKTEELTLEDGMYQKVWKCLEGLQEHWALNRIKIEIVTDVFGQESGTITVPFRKRW